MTPNFTISSHRKPETVDLTADSDDDDRPATRPNGNVRPGAPVVRRSGQSYVRSPRPATPDKGNGSSRPNGQSAAGESSPRRNTNRLSSSGARPGSGLDSAAPDILTSSQSQAASKPGERSQNSHKLTGLRKAGTQVPPSDFVVIDDDPPTFKMPRGLGAQNHKRPTLSDSSRENISSISKGQVKRQRDNDGRANDALPSKKQKLTPVFNDRPSMPAPDSPSQASPEMSLRTKHGLAGDDFSESSNGQSSKRAPLASPLHMKRDRRSPEPTNSDEASHKRIGNNSTQSPKSPSISDVRGAHPEGHGKERESANANSPSSRHRSNTPHKAASDDDDDIHSSGASAGHSSRRDTTPRVRKETAKAQALSAEKRIKSQSAAEGQSPSGQERSANVRLTDRQKPNLSINGTQDTSAKGRLDALASHKENRNIGTQHADNSQQSQAEKTFAKNEETKSELPSRTVKMVKDVPESSREGKPTNSEGDDASNTGTREVGLRMKGTGPVANESEVVSASNEVSSEPESSPPRARRREGSSTTDGLITDTPKSKLSDVTPHRSTNSEDKAGIKTPTALAEEADLQLRSEAMRSDDQMSVIGELKNSFVRPTMAASAMKPPSSYSKILPLAAQVKKILGKYLEELGDDNEYWTSVSLARARLSKEYSQTPDDAGNSVHRSGYEEKPTTFTKLRPLDMSTHQKGTPSAKSDRLWGVERMNTTGKGSGPTWLSADYSLFESDVLDVPSYAHYVSIKNNILAPNVTKLICWPYFGDDFETSYHTNLREQYHLDIDGRERKLVLLLKAQKYEEYVQSALEDLGCSWADVLRFLLEDEPDVGNWQDAMKAASIRDELLDDDFSRISERWQSILADLPASSPEKLARAAVLCDNFQTLAKFSLWHVARRSDFAKLPEEGHSDVQKALPSDNELTCRICLRFACPYHGELNEQAEDESDNNSESVVDNVVATDIIHPPRVNYRTRVAIPPSCAVIEDSGEVNAAGNDKKKPRFWRKDDFNHLPDQRGPFYPCHHPGTSCADAQCSCFENKIPCEKICSCTQDCPRKFQGCSCTTVRYKKGSRGPCFEDERCACYQSGRECDPDLCGDCGACEVIDPVNTGDDSVLAGRCRNCSIQRGVPKQTLLGDSGVHGLGLYACEDIREHDFVGEYKGEIITKEEAERRGAVYEIQKLSYLFSLNATQEIDSTNFGNKMRFINHAKGRANLYPRIIMVNAVHRIALYASCFIRLGQEVFFDYGPKFPDHQLGGKKSKKSAPHVRNANIVRNFFEVEESDDEVGNVRAKGVAHSKHSRNKARTNKPRGGARPNASRKPRERKGYDEKRSARAFTEQDAGERLAAFNISVEVRSDAMELDVDPGGDEDDEYEQEDGSDFGDSDASDSSVGTDSD